MFRREMVMGEMDLHELGRTQIAAGLRRGDRKNQTSEDEYSQSMSDFPHYRRREECGWC